MAKSKPMSPFTGRWRIVSMWTLEKTTSMNVIAVESRCRKASISFEAYSRNSFANFSLF